MPGIGRKKAASRSFPAGSPNSSEDERSVHSHDSPFAEKNNSQGPHKHQTKSSSLKSSSSRASFKRQAITSPAGESTKEEAAKAASEPNKAKKATRNVPSKPAPSKKEATGKETSKPSNTAVEISTAKSETDAKQLPMKFVLNCALYLPSSLDVAKETGKASVVLKTIMKNSDAKDIKRNTQRGLINFMTNGHNDLGKLYPHMDCYQMLLLRTVVESPAVLQFDRLKQRINSFLASNAERQIKQRHQQLDLFSSTGVKETGGNARLYYATFRGDLIKLLGIEENHLDILSKATVTIAVIPSLFAANKKKKANQKEANQFLAASQTFLDDILKIVQKEPSEETEVEDFKACSEDVDDWLRIHGKDKNAFVDQLVTCLVLSGKSYMLCSPTVLDYVDSIYAGEEQDSVQSIFEKATSKYNESVQTVAISKENWMKLSETMTITNKALNQWAITWIENDERRGDAAEEIMKLDALLEDFIKETMLTPPFEVVDHSIASLMLGKLKQTSTDTSESVPTKAAARKTKQNTKAKKPDEEEESPKKKRNSRAGTVDEEEEEPPKKKRSTRANTVEENCPKKTYAKLDSDSNDDDGLSFNGGYDEEGDDCTGDESEEVHVQEERQPSDVHPNEKLIEIEAQIKVHCEMEAYHRNQKDDLIKKVREIETRKSE